MAKVNCSRCGRDTTSTIGLCSSCKGKSYGTPGRSRGRTQRDSRPLSSDDMMRTTEEIAEQEDEEDRYYNR